MSMNTPGWLAESLLRISAEDVISPPQRRMRRGEKVIGELSLKSKKLFHLMQQARLCCRELWAEYREMVQGSEDDQSYLVRRESHKRHRPAGCAYCEKRAEIDSALARLESVRAALKESVWSDLILEKRPQSSEFFFELSSEWEVIVQKERRERKRSNKEKERGDEQVDHLRAQGRRILGIGLCV